MSELAPAARPRATPLRAEHEAAGARLAPFAGWELPLRFAGEVAEHHAVRSAVGIFDVSHLGTVWVAGPAAAATLGRALTADVDRLEDGASRYALCLDHDGGIVDDLIVARLSARRWLVVPNAANADAVVARLRATAAEVRRERVDAIAAAASADEPDPEALAVGTTTVHDATVGWATIAVQGPRSDALLADALDLDVADLPFTAVTERPVGAGGPAELHRVGLHLVVSRTGYTGERGVELQVPAEHARTVWRALLAGGGTPCGLGARDTLRLEVGYPLHGQDLGPDVRPAEGRVGWAVQATDVDGHPRRFVGAEALAADPGTRRSVGLRSAGRRPLRAGLPVLHDGRAIGVTTSGGFSPTLEVGIALARLDEAVAPGTVLDVDLRGTAVEVEVVRPPFVDRDPRDAASEVTPAGR